MAAEQLNLATQNAKNMLLDYSNSRSVFAQMVSDLKLTIETAKRDASMTSDLVTRIEAATMQLVNAQREAENYLTNVNKVLTESHQSFADNIERTLRSGNSEFQEELTKAVGLLSGSIKDLSDVAEEISDSKQKR